MCSCMDAAYQAMPHTIPPLVLWSCDINCALLKEQVTDTTHNMSNVVTHTCPEDATLNATCVLGAMSVTACGAGLQLEQCTVNP
jgi:hypothetical protein